MWTQDLRLIYIYIIYLERDNFRKHVVFKPLYDIIV